MKPVSLHSFLTLSLLSLQFLAGSSAFASDPIVPKNCDLEVKPQLVKRMNKRVIATIEGALDYQGRAFWWDLMSLTTTAAAAGAVGKGIRHGASQDEKDAASPAGAALGMSLSSSLLDATGNGNIPGVTPFVRKGGILPANAEANSGAWSDQATRELQAECRDRIRDEFPGDVIEDDGQELVAAHYECSDVYPVNEEAGVRLMINLIKSDPVFEKLSLAQALQLKCEKLQVCLIRAKPQELDWIYRTQANLGCGN